MRSPPDHVGLTRGMAALLWVAGGLVFLAGVQLFVFTERTDRYFAWTISPPLTAAFLGASYWSAVAFEWLAARQRRWADARIAVPTVFVFTTLTLVVTLVHLENFHLGEDFETATQAVTWAWIAIYTVVPVLMLLISVAQLRRAMGTRDPDPPGSATLPQWLAVLVAVQAAVFLVVGLGLLLAPTEIAQHWPWQLSALTGRAIGAWVFSLGTAATHALWEREPRRLRPAAAAFVLFGLLQAVALARYPHTVDWGDPTTVAYAVLLASTLVAGVSALAVDRRHAMSLGARKFAEPGA